MQRFSTAAAGALAMAPTGIGAAVWFRNPACSATATRSFSMCCLIRDCGSPMPICSSAVVLSALCFFFMFHIFARQLGRRIFIALAGALLVTVPSNLFFKVSGAIACSPLERVSRAISMDRR